MLRIAFDAFRLAANSELKAPFADFCREQSAWLDDYALFRALKNIYNGKAWNQVAAGVARVETWHRWRCFARSLSSASDIEAQKFFQFLFFRQWFALQGSLQPARHSVGRRHSDLCGPRLSRRLDQSGSVQAATTDGSPIVVAGVPPRLLQRHRSALGNPLYNWDRMLRGRIQVVDRARARDASDV